MDAVLFLGFPNPKSQSPRQIGLLSNGIPNRLWMARGGKNPIYGDTGDNLPKHLGDHWPWIQFLPVIHTTTTTTTYNTLIQIKI
jgi:hypothetical protein